MADITVTGNQAYFNEDAKFFKDVYVYGTLYYDFEAKAKETFNDIDVLGDLTVKGSSRFEGDVYLNTSLTVATLNVEKTFYANVGSASTFYGSADFYGRTNIDFATVGILTVTNRLDVGTGGNVLTARTDTSRIGIGSTNPEQKLDIIGSIKISEDIYDSSNSSGGIGYYLTQDVNGIKWTPFQPTITEGITVYNDGVDNTKYIDGSPDAGVSSFRGLNLKSGNNSAYRTFNPVGLVTDPIQAFVNPTNPYIADIYIYDFWEVSGNSIYRNSNVGINNNSPSVALDVTGSARVTGTLNVNSNTQSTSKDTGALIITDGGLGVEGNINAGGSLDITGSATINSSTQSTSKDTGAVIISNGGLGVEGNINAGGSLNVDGSADVGTTLNVDGETTLRSTLKVGPNQNVIVTNVNDYVGFNTINPTKPVDVNADMIIRKKLYDSHANVGYRTEYYQTPRAVLTSVGVGTTGEIIGGRFFDAANLIRLNLDFIAAEAVGYITSTDYKTPAFTLSSGDYTNCKEDIKSIFKAITLDITRGGNVNSVGAGLSYYNGPSLIHITGVKAETMATIGAAATVARYVINNVPLPKSYQSGISSIKQVRDLTLQDDPSVNSNTNPNGCSNVVSAIYTCTSIINTIIDGGPSAAPPINQPDGKVVWAPAGADSRNLIWVSKYGNDDNGGRTEGDAKLTIAAAAEIAEPGDTIVVKSGIYYENNPIGLRTDVSVSGQDLRLVTVVPKNLGKDVFHVRRGCLIENMNFACETGQSNPGGGAVAFPPTIADINSGKSYGAVSGYTAVGPANEGPSGRWRSPYVRNCTNFMPLSIGMKINGDHAVSSTIGADLKCMVCDSFTQYNEAGIGVSITNNGYAQLVSIFTINCDIAIYCDSGGSCDLTNSNSSFGNYGLYAVGVGRTEFTATVGNFPQNFTEVITRTIPGVDAGSDRVTFVDMKDNPDNPGISTTRRPYDGQALFFEIDLSKYPDAQGVGILTAPMVRVGSIEVTNGGSGYSASSPPTVFIYDANDPNLTQSPKGPQGIIAELSPTVDENGKITAIDVVNSGRNYLPSQNLQVFIDNSGGSGGASATVILDPIYYTVDSSTDTTPVTGITTITFNQFIPYELFGGEKVSLKRISRILTSSHSFEYIGTGTDINISTPFKGSVPIKENEIVALDGAQIPFTSTDQKGNFDIGEGLQINQPTRTIRGRDFSRAIQAEITPLILALR